MAAAACVPFLALGVAVLGVRCGTGASGSFRLIQFKAPSPPDPKLQPLLENAKTIGILSATNIESVKRLDIEKVMGRLTDVTASVLRRSDRKVVTQDEIHWHFERMEFDSASVFGQEMQKSLREGFGLTVTEALWKCKPVIGGAVGGIRSQLLNGVTGFLVHSPEGAANRAVELLGNPKLRDALGDAGHDHVKENFLTTRHIRDYLLLMLAMEHGDTDLSVLTASSPR